MNKIEQLKVKEFLFSPLLLILLSIYIFNIFSYGVPISQMTWETILWGLTDHYYLLYMLLPVYMYLILKIQQTHEHFSVIRHRTFFHYFRIHLMTGFVSITSFIILHVLILLPVLIINGQLFDVHFNYTDYTHTLSPLYAAIFPNTFISVIATLTYMIMGLFYIYIIISVFSLFFGQRNTYYFVIFLIISMIFALRSGLDDILYPFFLNNYYILHHTFDQAHQYIQLMVLMIVVIIVLLYVVKHYWYKTIYFQGITMKNWFISFFVKPKVLLVILLFICVNVVLFDLREAEYTFIQLLLNDFIGYGYGYFDITTFMKYVFVIGIPLYMIGMYIDQEVSGRSSIIVVRFHSYKQLWFQMQKAITTFIVVYCTGYVCISMLSALMIGGSWTNAPLENFVGTSTNLSFLVGIMISFFIMVLEINLLQLLMNVLMAITNNLYVAFLIIAFGYGLLFMSANVIQYVPWGISSIVRIDQFTGDFVFSGLIVMVVMLALNVCLYYLIEKRLLKQF
ncbi:hypothetical protein [Pontibacillus litoralis]|uniref:Permease n=1 Tax=Pontibacillus litoralis JSM 072002 TaxID=1385512 RepID=A0A0A5G7E0_9BACI|nr:hypothetical protein [Pontibacillus litoralis]KGX87088.1 hypothetical protein N784_02775 [Pontibacillus litoralis JSM 072002]